MCGSAHVHNIKKDNDEISFLIALDPIYRQILVYTALAMQGNQANSNYNGLSSVIQVGSFQWNGIVFGR